MCSFKYNVFTHTLSFFLSFSHFSLSLFVCIKHGNHSRYIGRQSSKLNTHSLCIPFTHLPTSCIHREKPVPTEASSSSPVQLARQAGAGQRDPLTKKPSQCALYTQNILVCSLSTGFFVKSQPLGELFRRSLVS